MIRSASMPGSPPLPPWGSKPCRDRAFPGAGTAGRAECAGSGGPALPSFPAVTTGKACSARSAACRSRNRTGWTALDGPQRVWAPLPATPFDEESFPLHLEEAARGPLILRSPAPAAAPSQIAVQVAAPAGKPVLPRITAMMAELLGYDGRPHRSVGALLGNGRRQPRTDRRDQPHRGGIRREGPGSGFLRGIAVPRSAGGPPCRARRHRSPIRSPFPWRRAASWKK